MTFKEWLEKHGLSKFSLSSAWKSIFKKKFEHGEEPDEDEKKKLMGGEEPDEDDKKKLEDEKNPDEKEGQLDDGDAIRATIAEALAPIVEDIKSIKEKIGMADDDDDDDDNDNGPASGGEEQPAEMKAFREKMAKQDAEIYALKKKEAKREKEAKFSSMVEKAIRTDLAGREIDEELKSNLFKMAQGGDDVFKVYVDTLKDRLSTDGPRDEYGIDEALTRFNDEENETLASFKTLGADVYEAAMRHTQTYAALKSVGHAKCSLGEHVANQLRAEGGHDMKKISKLVKSK